MQLQIGNIYEGKVTKIMAFGAFVEIEKGTTGMVHISEVANTFVNDINEFLKEGDTVKVKVLSVDEKGKVSFSIKKALPEQPKQSGRFNDRNDKNDRADRNDRGDRQSKGKGGYRKQDYRSRTDDSYAATGVVPPPQFYTPKKSSDESFEDMLSKFKADSEVRMSELKHITENKRRSPSRKK